MLGQLTGDAVPLTSEGALGLDTILGRGVREKPDINGMAVAGEQGVKVLLWNYHDDLVETAPAAIKLCVTLPAAYRAVRVTHYRIDDTHSNAFTKWLELGSPQAPDDQALDKLKAAMQLQTLEPARAIEVENGRVLLDFEMPRFALSLIVLEKSGR
jgi:xylan 1,4-beta-xylosidase